MRLTLRTLLAWLDDTLQPTAGQGDRKPGRGQSVRSGAYRPHSPGHSAAPAVGAEQLGPGRDRPQLVASYLDNELDPDAVAEYEKKCLSSDVNLAEVASVHQILSLLGHKVKVPAAARSRMYQLVKGREAIAQRQPAAQRADSPEPVTKPINQWVVPEAPRRPWIERFGPGVACLLLIGLTSVDRLEELDGAGSGGLPPTADRGGQGER